MTEVQFLFGTDLIAALTNLIKNAKHRLLLISPYIDLDKRIQDALLEHKSKHEFELLVLFGKNEGNLYKSIKRDSLNFLKQFPNIDIRYNGRLHAKFYQNDFHYIMTSLNLYDYSLANNIESGIIVNHAAKGILGKVIEGSGAILSQGVDKVSQDVFGSNKDVNPMEEFQKIFDSSEKKYKTEPIKVDKDGIKGFFGGQKLNGFTIKIDNLSNEISEIKIHKAEINSSVSREFNKIKIEKISTTSVNTKSAKQLSTLLNVPPADITAFMQKAGLINGDKITATGLAKGLVIKNYMGNDYVAYPENLAELKGLKKQLWTKRPDA